MELDSNNTKKIIAGVVIIAAIALLGIGATLLKKDGTPSVNESTTANSLATSEPTSQTATPTQTRSATYKDGTYTSSGAYQSPGGREKISVTITVKDGTVTESNVEQEANNRDSEQYQKEFKAGYKEKVVGRKLSDIKLSTVSGSSLTSEGFNEALEAIKTQATQA